MFTNQDGEWMICYHGRTEKTGQDRIGFISPARISGDGKLTVVYDGSQIGGRGENP